MITGFAVRNFKSLVAVPASEDALLAAGPVNVLIGPNGCGKSSLLQAIDFLRGFFESSVEIYLQGRGWHYGDLPNLRQARKTIRWQLEATLGPGEDGCGAGQYSYAVSLQPRKHLGIGEETLEWRASAAARPEVLLQRKGRTVKMLDRERGEPLVYRMVGLPASMMSQLGGARDARRYPELLRFRSWIRGFRPYLMWDPKILRSPARAKRSERLELGPSGENLAALIGDMRDKRPAAFERLVRRVRRLFPTITDISVSGTGWGWRTIRLHEENGQLVSFNSQQASDGILRLLAIATLLYVDSPPTVLTLEEPENGVHPQLVRQVVQILREVAQRKTPNGCQIFFTTHSPYVLDEFFDHPEQVYCMDRPGPQKGATVLRLSENRQLDIARETFSSSLGEAWTSGLLGATAGVRLR